MSKAVLEKNIHNSIEKYKKLISEKMKLEQPFHFYTLKGDRAEVVSFIPIKHNFRDEVPAWIVSYEENQNIVRSLEAANNVRIVGFILLSIIFYFLYRVVNQREYLDRVVKDKTGELLKLNRELEESEQELQVINENLEAKIKEEVDKNRNKDIILAQQSKLASLGEMIENIAHQWRQPLSIISTAASGLKLQKEMGSLDEKVEVEYLDRIVDTSRHLSDTINDFRDFFKQDKSKTKFFTQDLYTRASKIISSKFTNQDIEIIENIENIEYYGLENELTQVLINILNNAKDALAGQEKRKLIFVDIYKEDKSLVISIKDNAGGIQEDIISKIFDPYFTTKHKSQGTGIGLYMSAEIIIKHFEGEIFAQNVSYEYESVLYDGAEFIIQLPLSGIKW